MAKKYTANDLEAVQNIASQFKLKYWKLCNVFGQELKVCSVLSKDQLADVFNYLNSDFVDEGEYMLVGKAGNQSKAETKLRITKGSGEGKTITSPGIVTNYNYPENYEKLVKENAELRADKYYLEELVKQKDDKISELLEELLEEPENKINWHETVKEYGPQAFTLLQSILVKPGPMPSFADPAPTRHQMVRFTPDYYQFLKANQANTALLKQELDYVQAHKPERYNEWEQAIFG